jgi:hypothetical protein
MSYIPVLSTVEPRCEYYQRRVQALVDEAAVMGIIITVKQVPIDGAIPKMGQYRTVCEVRPNLDIIRLLLEKKAHDAKQADRQQ